MTCEFYTSVPHSTMDKCIPKPGKPGNTVHYSKQCFYYNQETGQLFDADNNCLTIMSPNSEDFRDSCHSCREITSDGFMEDECNPCGTMAAGGYPDVGGLIYTWPCIDGGDVYQAWTLNNSVIQSQCPHGYYLGQAFPFLTVVNYNNKHESYILTYGIETSIPEKFPYAGFELAKLVLGEEITSKLKDHGCWCSKLGLNRYAGGDALDELDQICKNWAQARRCALLPNGRCEGRRHRETANYTISLDKNECPWTMPGESQDITCGVVPGMLNPEGCLTSKCEIDKHYIIQIRKYFEVHVFNDVSGNVFTPVIGDREKCRGCGDCIGNPGVDPGDGMRFVCEGVSPEDYVIVREEIVKNDQL